MKVQESCLSISRLPFLRRSSVAFDLAQPFGALFPSWSSHDGVNRDRIIRPHQKQTHLSSPPRPHPTACLLWGRFFTTESLRSLNWHGVSRKFVGSADSVIKCFVEQHTTLRCTLRRFSDWALILCLGNDGQRPVCPSGRIRYSTNSESPQRSKPRSSSLQPLIVLVLSTVRLQIY